MRSTLHDDSSSEDEEDQLLREEQEQERLLSEQHGEANEGPASSSSNKRQSDADIADALNSNEAVKKKKLRVTLTAPKLTGPQGLIRIRHEFGTQVKFRQPKPVKAGKDKKIAKRKQFERDIHASAVYAGKLMQAYQEFAIDIAPNMHYNDTFHKIQDLGSKKDVRDYLDTMRQEVCKEHLEKIYGRDKAEKFVHELENGLQTAKDDLYDNYDDVGGTGVSKRLALLEGVDDEMDNQESAVTGSARSEGGPSASNRSTGRGAELRSDPVDDDEDENEASFDDVVPSTTQVNEDKSEEIEGSKDDGVDEEIEAAMDTDGGQDDLEEPRAEAQDDQDGLQEPKADEEEGQDDLEEPRADDADGQDDLGEPRAEAEDDQDGLQEPKADEEDGQDDLGEPRADDAEEDQDDLEEPSADARKEFESSPRDASDKNDAEEEANDVLMGEQGDDAVHNSISGIEMSQGQDVVDDRDENAIVEFSQTQETLFDASQTEGVDSMAQDTLVFDSSQTTQGTQGATQDTLVFDSTQNLSETQSQSAGGSQDY